MLLNYSKLREDIVEKGYTVLGVAEKIGYTRTGLSNALRIGTLKEKKFREICEIIGTRFDSYLLSDIQRLGLEASYQDQTSQLKSELSQCRSRVKELEGTVKDKNRIIELLEVQIDELQKRVKNG